VFKKWSKKRVLKKLQEDCIHEYHIVSTYETDIGGSFDYKWVTRHDMYCPICDKTVYEVTTIQAEREIERQKVRNEYKESY
jgi:hypothetical protein